MAGKFARILAFMGLASDTEPVTEAHLQTANDKIAQLEADKTAAEQKVTTAETALATTQASLDTSKTELATATGKVNILEAWKKEQKATDARQEDESNKLDTDGDEPKAAFEMEASAAIARVKRRLGEK